MENTTKAGTFHLQKTRIVRGIILVLFSLILCRGPLMGGCFPAAIALVGYFVSRNTVNLYLAIPAAIGIIPYVSRGYDPWGDLAAMCVCGLFFVAARRIRMQLWQRALIAAAIGIICVSLYRLATATVYQISVEKLLMEGLLIFALFFVFDTIYGLLERNSAGEQQAEKEKDSFRELSMTSFTALCLMTAHGIGLSFLLWPITLFLLLWTLVELDAGSAALVAAAGGLITALAEQGQWGLMATAVLGSFAAAFVKKYGMLAVTVVFTGACWALGAAESGVVLGVDGYCLFLASATFLTVYWKFGSSMRRFLRIVAGSKTVQGEISEHRAEAILQSKISEMEGLAELYATYLDSRSMLANQFNITRQIMEDIRWQLGRGGRKAARAANQKFYMKIAVSQCAASGAINGDCCGWQEIGNGKIAMVVSDGMGKGKKAAAESLMVTKTIMALLKSGVTADLTLKMINTIMLMKEDEDSYATVDLVTVDQKTGKARFYKIGAAPTLIRRKSNVEEVKLSAVPLGIVNGLKIRYVETILKKDDWIIMMSDGVSDGGDGRDGKSFLYHIKETAGRVRSTDPQTMSDLILNQAADSYIGRERDDLTVMVARVL